MKTPNIAELNRKKDDKATKQGNNFNLYKALVAYSRLKRIIEEGPFFNPFKDHLADKIEDQNVP